MICGRPGRELTRADSKIVSNHAPSSNERPTRHANPNVRPIPDRAVAIFLIILVAIIALGYLLMTTLAGDTRAENCMMEHRKNCGAIEWPSS